MKFEPRKYQQDCVDALWQVVDTLPDKNPVIAVPTGAGKTVIMGMFIEKYMKKFPYDKITVLSHTQDILQQDYEALQEILPYDEIGMYSAGLGIKIIGQVTVAGIQSAYKHPELFEPTNLYIIDEAHTVNHKARGMYRSLIGKTKSIVVGMSATVFRTGHGYIYDGEKTLFDTLAYDLTSVDNFNKLIDDGYLTNLISLQPEMKMDVQGVKYSAGDYNTKSLSDKFNRDSITKAGVSETIKYGQKYKKWLIFAIDIDHANSICEEIKRGGIDADVLHSKMYGDRTTVINDFRNGSTRCLVSVGMVTTGFDAPNVDLIVLLRPTMSAVLHVQMVGRGLRVAPEKDHCLVLDFAGNTKRLGPINDVTVPKQKGKGTGKVPTKTCPVCAVITHTSARECKVCGHKFEFKVKLTTTASSDAIVKREKVDPPLWLTVNNVQYRLHNKQGMPPSIMVIYHCGYTTVKDWVHPEHSGYAGRKAAHWLNVRGYTGSLTTYDVLYNREDIKKSKRILVDFKPKYPRILDAVF